MPNGIDQRGGSARPLTNNNRKGEPAGQATQGEAPWSEKVPLSTGMNRHS